MAGTILRSDWTGLSRHLIASIYPVRQVPGASDALEYERVPDSIEVQAPISDGALEQTATWTSPFENQMADAKLSTFSSMLQSGGFKSTLEALAALFPKGGTAQNALETLNKGLEGMLGKTAITKLNSVQIFTGMPPMKLNVTAHFRATSNADVEVQAPLAQLMEWALPKKLSNVGIVTNLLNRKGVVDSLYSSDAPQILGMSFADMLFIPVVIESMSHPITGPRDSDGTMISAQTTLSISTLSALDASDWNQVFA